MARKPFETIEPDPHREFIKPIYDGIPVGTIRSAGFKPAETEDKACPHCGDVQPRTKWQLENRFKCYECHKFSDEKVEVHAEPV